MERAQECVRNRGFTRMAERAPAALPVLAIRAETGDDAEPTMFGHFAVFDRWTEIDSMFEGHFLERIAPGAFKKTFSEGSPRALFQHGADPQIGDKPLGAPSTLREDVTGAYYEVPLLDAPYVRNDVLPGLRAGLYGASFRFRAMRETFNNEPERSDHNPDGLPERTLKEVQVPEFGPVTFPAYPAASAGVRAIAPADADEDTSQDEAVPVTSERRETRPARDYLSPESEVPSWILP